MSLVPKPSTALRYVAYAIAVFAWESGTTYVELILGAYTLAAFCVLEAWRRFPSDGAAILFGLLIAGAINTKYHGFAVALAFAPSVLWELRRGVTTRQIALAVAVAVAAILPFMLRNAVVAGDPLAPLSELTSNIGTFGAGDGLFYLLRAPWDISVYSARHFDGHVLGTPYLLALMPWAFLARGQIRGVLLRALVPTFLYFVLWFFLLSQQVRFLLPIAPFLSLVAAVGAVEVWRTLRTSLLARACFVVLAAALSLGQAAYLGATVLIRAPVILGLIDETAYFTRIPTIQGSHFVPCRYLSERLTRGNTYLMFLSLRSYYCPQASVATVDTQASPNVIVEQLRAKRVQYLIVETGREQRNNPEGVTSRHQVDPATLVGPVIGRTLARIEPVFRDDFATIYAVRGIIDELER